MFSPQKNTAGKLITGYSYSFNGMEKDDEVKGEGNSYTTEFRQYDSRVGRWLSLEPIPNHGQSPYVSLKNNPIAYIDPQGSLDYYNKRGRYIGTDGNANGKVYLNVADRSKQYVKTIALLKEDPTKKL